MTIGEALHKASKTLAAHSFEEASLEAEILLMHVLGIDRAKLYAVLGEELSNGDAEVLTQLVNRRLTNEPVAYIVGHREFFGYDFHVAPGVLIPRPESELLVEETLYFVRGQFPAGDPVIAEIGTGSGAIAISLALLLPKAEIYATDISASALEIAKVNCERHGVQDRVHLLEGDVLAPLIEPVDIIIANLPYIGDAELNELDDEIRMFEPLEALAGGGDGLDRVRQLLVKVGEKLRPEGLILLEIGYVQGGAAASLRPLLPLAASVELVKDLGGRARVLKIRI
ncbi:MAG: peptide chain release factor N(5)-glutamine methyltransferase [Dehalococcoidia bacterium]